MLWHNHCFAQICLLIGTVYQVSGVAHESLVDFKFYSLTGESHSPLHTLLMSLEWIKIDPCNTCS